MYGNMHLRKKKFLIKLCGRAWIGVSGNLAPGGRGKRRGTNNNGYDDIFVQRSTPLRQNLKLTKKLS